MLDEVSMIKQIVNKLLLTCSSNEWNFSGASSASAKFFLAFPTRRLKTHPKATKDNVTNDVRGYSFILSVFFF